MNVLHLVKSIAKEEEVKTIALKAEPSKTVETNEKKQNKRRKLSQVMEKAPMRNSP